MQYLALPPWGDARIRCMSALPGKEGLMVKQFEKDYGKYAVLVDSDSLIRTGIFGKKKVSSVMRSRFGTHIALAKAGVMMDYEYPIKRTKRWVGLKGVHSGLSKEEMQVPVITYS
jgi:hypothetical protein